MGISRQASRLPLTALSWGLEAWERSAGLRQFALRRGNEALQIAAHTPLGRLLPKLVLDDGADEEAARITAAVRADSPSVTTKPDTPKPTTSPTASRSPSPAADPVREARAAEAAREVGAPGAVAAEVEQVVDQLAIPEPESRDELPIPDFDNITLGSLRARLRNLSVEQLVVLREWEQAHAHRLPVLTALDNRIAKVSAEAYPEADNPTTSNRPA